MRKTGELYKQYSQRISERDFYASKSDYGKLLILAGSRGMAGAAYLSGLAAFRSGIGMVRYFGPECNRTILQTLLPEAMYDAYDDAADTELQINSSGRTVGFAETADSAEAFVPPLLHKKLAKALSWADYLVCGPGLSQNEAASLLIRELFSADLSEKKLVLLDADALNICASEGRCLRELSMERFCKGLQSNVVITPHPGEMSRLAGLPVPEILSRKAELAASWSQEQNCTTVLKDAVSIVSTPEGEIYENNSGHAAMAKAGSGDVLTGVIAGMTAVTRGSAAAGAVIGTFVHGKAGELAAERFGAHSTLARDIADAVSGVIGHKTEMFS